MYIFDSIGSWADQILSENILCSKIQKYPILE